MKVKKFLPFLLALCMCGGILAGCNNGSGGGSNAGGGNEAGNESGNEGGNESGNEGGNESGNEGGNESGNEGGNESGNESGNEGGNEAGNESGNEGGNESGNESGNEAGNESGNESGNEGGNESGNEGGNESGNEGGNESGNESGNEGGSGSEEENKDTSVALATGSCVYVVGDSTVCEYFDKNGNPSDDFYLPRYGYGTQLHKYLNVSESQVKNLALSGRSSKSFLGEANYKTLKNNIKEGDYLIIGFGHNDEKSDDSSRFTDPKGTKDIEETAKGTSFKYCLFENYIKIAKEVNATPILCTPITRYDSGGNYQNGKVHVTADGDYPQAILDLAEETDTTVVDLCKITSEVYKEDNDAAALYHAHTTYAGARKTDGYDGSETPDGRDDTHINMYGAKMVSYHFAQAIKETECPLNAQVRTNTSAPTKEKDYVEAIYQKFVRTEYSSPNLSKLFTFVTTGSGESQAKWYSSAFGVLGGDSKTTEYKFSKNQDKTVYTITAGTGSKFAATQDGMGAIFTQLGLDKNFTVTVKAKITAVNSNITLNNQVAFGLMLRDDMYASKNLSSVKSNFVSASVVGDGSTLMRRESKTELAYDGESMACAVGNEYEMSISRTGQEVVVTVKLGDKTVSESYLDFSFVGIDKDYFYLCLFANRGLTVEFSELDFRITGDSQGA